MHMDVLHTVGGIGLVPGLRHGDGTQRLCISADTGGVALDDVCGIVQQQIANAVAGIFVLTGSQRYVSAALELRQSRDVIGKDGLLEEFDVIIADVVGKLDGGTGSPDVVGE